MSSKGETPVFFRFYGSLNDFLPGKFRQRNLIYHFQPEQTLKDAIEAMGVPHPEVHLILLNGEPASFSTHLQAQSRIAVYPFFFDLELPERMPVNARTHLKLRFMLDVHLGKLAKYLRFAGFDTLIFPNLTDREIVDIGARENRIILTRDIGLLKHKKVKYGYWLRSQNPEKQFYEVASHFRIKRKDLHPWKRCSICNSIIKPVEKPAIESGLQPGTKNHFNEFYQCSGCGRVYWKGSHYERLNKWMMETINNL